MNKMMRVAALLLMGLSASSAEDLAPKHELSFLLGGVFGEDRSGTASLHLGPGVALQVNYGRRLFARDKVAIYGEVHFLGSPLREITSSDPTLTRDVATVFLTPGIRVKLLPNKAVAPYFFAGGGWVDYEQSLKTIAGQLNPASRLVNHAAFDFGGGADIKFWRFVGLRAEVRDFYAGAPSYNTDAIHGGQHNVVASGGIVVKIH